MRAVIQRVNYAEIHIQKQLHTRIETGLVVLLGFTHTDTCSDADYLIDKFLNLRLFEDTAGKMNLSMAAIQGEVLLVSQFTLYGDCRKGRRPSFDPAAKPDIAKPLYDYVVQQTQEKYPRVKSGVFGADMQLRLENNGPVTFIL